ncbi:TonB C-terminal domain-containing protein [Sphingopyxis indica]|uniref:secretin and TonB N-terminal domain-containing protein n=1 Tax=Sphingopyxis indica TaxID=436663 RepID=UPI002939455E|nr:secretin and TonB N-terminal domain-containing protein [Sphingopyxis indica]MEA3390824.1 TonB C-terminal domain-containing protein [Pseudomonadota bacterium]WOF43309.1 TonB C-terminal domain-containing protein [Sphingopyxis indica]
MTRVARIPFIAVRRSGRGLLLVAAIVFTICMAGAAAAQTAPAMQERRYDIPAQPVAQAIAEFATVSGVNIIYRQSLAGARQSTPLSGVYAAPAALRHLLQGTGLSARFTGPNSAVIFVEGQPPPTDRAGNAVTASPSALHLDMAEVRAPRLVGRRDPSAYNHYAQRVQTEIFERLKRDGAYEGRSFRIEIAVSVDPTGRIDEVRLMRGSSEPDWDARVRQILFGTLISSPPPEGLSRSMRFEVETDRFAGREARPGGRRRQ